ncbi:MULTISPECIES: DUF779 domain-containing protein [Streptomyces]|jgi:uncharacterized protein (DUF779 family)|uniref:DUF779 domain-containing protein n=3 Tax=Streptomyces TaxID=1883 RepID=A0A1G7SV00_9ACTN|nr:MULTISPECIES: DUF779 domain-containing protein [Streptomyces]MBA5221935.1 DUF779 domain-containing protein [Streptomyces griseoaurantiacus]MDX3088277.1 DUF779 domain-containing protein [Streptomyces sp. ME12-02E]MDX3331608.1 DUF779 domain-containing protein [Streptomyces sp. ME02-6978a]MDX3358346.1 DUF779 domain-containing protein [Streptomyces sp. ME02-6978.2a]NJP71160.1 DUF779 domain-containing protein [Streptomyces sp. C1-2]
MEDADRDVESVPRVALTPAAGELLRRLRAEHGPLMFHQSGGCCDGSAPMCYPEGEFRTGGSDVLLAELEVDGVGEPVGFWMSRSQYEVWAHTRLIVDVVPGRGSGFSLEAPEGVRFLIRSRVVDA